MKKKIKKLTPFEALENLKNLSRDVQYASKIPSIDNELKIIETELKENWQLKDEVQALKEINQEEHKALEIIKRFKKDKYSKIEIDGNDIIMDVYLTLNDDEIDLLKEVLLCD